MPRSREPVEACENGGRARVAGSSVVILISPLLFFDRRPTGPTGLLARSMPCFFEILKGDCLDI